LGEDDLMDELAKFDTQGQTNTNTNQTSKVTGNEDEDLERMMAEMLG